jgi:hypothetical protein
MPDGHVLHGSGETESGVECESENDGACVAPRVRASVEMRERSEGRLSVREAAPRND